MYTFTIGDVQIMIGAITIFILGVIWTKLWYDRGFRHAKMEALNIMLGPKFGDLGKITIQPDMHIGMMGDFFDDIPISPLENAYIHKQGHPDRKEKPAGDKS